MIQNRLKKMISKELKIRVRFNETDSMNYLYHGNYASYYHASRTELLRELDLCDKTLGKQNVILPVVESHSKYIKPAFYDDELIVKTNILKMSGCRIYFYHEIYKNEVLINRGDTTIAYVDKISEKPIKIPDLVRRKLSSLVKTI